VSDAIDFNTFDKLGFNDFGDSGMLIMDETPGKSKDVVTRASQIPTKQRIDTKFLDWASSQFACFRPVMQSWTDITHSVKPFSSVRIPGLENEQVDNSKPQLICGEIPQDAEKSLVYVFNRMDGKVHTFSTFGGVRDEREGETW
jgi:hypothetical protein